MTTALPTNKLTLYGLSRSVYTRIARLALEEKGLSYELEEVEIFGTEGVPHSHLRRHPFGRIPVLRHADLMLYETAAITRYIDECFPGPSLQPAAASHRARMNQIIGLLDSYAYRPMVWGVFVQRVRAPAEGGQSDEAQIAQALEVSRTCLRALKILRDGQSFLAGPELSLADLHAFPMLQYFALAPEGAALLRQFDSLTQWLENIAARPSTVRTRSVYERLA